ncbi:MAG: hypothetical protein ACJAZO_002958 [Myxococcota bacterium]|jgi:hypothetical protein
MRACNAEQPQRTCPSGRVDSSDEKRRSGQASRTDQRVRYWNTNAVNQRQTKANFGRHKLRRRSLVRDAHDDEQEDEGQQDLSDETREEGVVAWGERAIAVGYDPTGPRKKSVFPLVIT